MADEKVTPPEVDPPLKEALLVEQKELSRLCAERVKTEKTEGLDQDPFLEIDRQIVAVQDRIRKLLFESPGRHEELKQLALHDVKKRRALSNGGLPVLCTAESVRYYEFVSDNDLKAASQYGEKPVQNALFDYYSPSIDEHVLQHKRSWVHHDVERMKKLTARQRLLDCEFEEMKRLRVNFGEALVTMMTAHPDAEKSLRTFLGDKTCLKEFLASTYADYFMHMIPVPGAGERDPLDPMPRLQSSIDETGRLFRKLPTIAASTIISSSREVVVDKPVPTQLPSREYLDALLAHVNHLKLTFGSLIASMEKSTTLPFSAEENLSTVVDMPLDRPKAPGHFTIQNSTADKLLKAGSLGGLAKNCDAEKQGEEARAERLKDMLRQKIEVDWARREEEAFAAAHGLKEHLHQFRKMVEEGRDPAEVLVKAKVLRGMLANATQDCSAVLDEKAWVRPVGFSRKFHGECAVVTGLDVGLDDEGEFSFHRVEELAAELESARREAVAATTAWSTIEHQEIPFLKKDKFLKQKSAAFTRQSEAEKAHAQLQRKHERFARHSKILPHVGRLNSLINEPELAPFMSYGEVPLKTTLAVVEGVLDRMEELFSSEFYQGWRALRGVARNKAARFEEHFRPREAAPAPEGVGTDFLWVPG